MSRVSLAICLLFSAACSIQAAQHDARKLLEYAPAPVDNPLKGLVPYQANVESYFPHSMEFNYLAYSSIVKGYDEFDWEPMERLLNDIASRGHQAVFRVFLEYPNRKEIIPEFLIRDGLKVHKYTNTNTQPLPPSPVETPDYEDRNLRRSMKNFIVALGGKYDGDPRIGFITAGLLGTWGEWHNYPRDELFASKEVQQEVLDAYERAFKITPVLLRYPVGDNDEGKAKNANREFGYHDDSFAWATLDTGKQADDWFYMAILKAAGSEALSKWKKQPIGGEIRPEAWGQVFDKEPQDNQVQNFRKCVEATHVSWLMDSGMFQEKQATDRIQRAETEVRRMGYEFHALAVTIGRVDHGEVPVDLELENRGVAPFYYDWKPEYGLLVDGQAVKTYAGSGTLGGLLPGDKPVKWSDSLKLNGIRAGLYTVAVRVPNPMPGGNSIRFANATQDANGWLVLGVLQVQ